MVWKTRRPNRNLRVCNALGPVVEALEGRKLLTVLSVNSLADGPVNLGDSTVTLRDAIQAANSDAAVFPGGPIASGFDEIRFSISFGFARTISLTQGQLVLASNMTITGPGANVLTISAAGLSRTGGSRVLAVTNSLSSKITATVSGLTIAGGNSGASAGGGIIIEDNLTLRNCTVRNNRSSVNGGGIDIEPVGTLTVQNSFINSNSATLTGGGIRNNGALVVENSTISGNAAGTDGGAIFNNNGFMRVQSSTISGNTASNRGGGISHNNGLSQGASSSPIVLFSTISGNSALGAGGGIFNTGTGLGTLNLQNTTISGNAAFGSGGGIFSQAPLTLRNCTITQNHADNNNSNPLFDRGGGLFASTVPPVLHNTIVADNFRLSGTTSENDISGTVNSGSTNNLIGTGGSGGLVHSVNGNLVGIVDPMIGPLADNGGPTRTHAPVSFPTGKSPIDAGNNAQAVGSTDQRGGVFKRIAGGTVDIGAVESQLGNRLVDTDVDELDNNEGKGDLSLREAIQLANADAGSDIIGFDPAVFSTPRTITLNRGPLTIVTNATVAGPGANLLVINGNHASSVFNTLSLGSPKNITIFGLAIFGGNSANGGGISNSANLTVQNCNISGNTAISGGGIFNSNAGTVALVNSTLALNRASNGAGIFNNGALTIRNSTLSNNLATIDGGGILNNGTLSLTTSTITQNHADNDNNGSGVGGGIRIPLGIGTLTNSIVAANFSRSATLFADDVVGTLNGTSMLNLFGIGGSGGLANGDNGNQVVADPKLGPLASNGGPTQTHALLPGSPAINAGGDFGPPPITPITDQRGMPFIRVADGRQDIGAYEVQSLNLAVNIITDEDDGKFGLPDPADVEEADLSLREAIRLTNENPGADAITFNTGFINFNFQKIMVLTKGNLVISDDLTLTGPGADLLTLTPSGTGFSQIFHVNDFSPTTTKSVTISGLGIAGGNSASVGGGLTNFENLTLQSCAVTNNRAVSNGGGISNFGTLTVVNSLINGNLAGERGGGIFSDDQRSLTLQNCTISGNQAGIDGGGIFNDGNMTVESSTITQNHSDSNNDTLGAGGGLFLAPSIVTLHNTIVADNFRGSGSTADDDITTAEGLALQAPSTNNLIGTGGAAGLVNGVNGNLVGVADPMLSPLGNNGGPTRTHVLLAGSPAIDAGDPANFPGTDQRGITRPQDGNIDGAASPDIGAFERRPDEPDPDSGPVVGTFELSPTNATVSAGALVNYAFSWTVPSPENWHNLEWLQLRIREGDQTILWLKFDEATKLFSVSKHEDGKFGEGFAAGTDKQLKTSAATLYLADTSVVASGPTSPTVTVNLSLSFKGKSAGQSFIVEVAAKNDLGDRSGFDRAGVLEVTRKHDARHAQAGVKPIAAADDTRLPASSINHNVEMVLD